MSVQRRSRDFDRRARAFVLGLGRNGLDCVRSLGMEGTPTTGLDWELDGPGFKSRYCDARVCPNPKIEPERLLAFLLAEGNRLDRPAVLIPTSDTQVMFMSRYRSELSRYFLFN